jgi:hypothetical protein
LARNESLFREVNERIAEAAKRIQAVPDAEFLCECGRPDCLERMAIPLEEYERVRAHPARFLLLPGHEQLDVDAVIISTDSHVVVEKIGEAREVATERDPRT